jgi:hypothetical protein
MDGGGWCGVGRGADLNALRLVPMEDSKARRRAARSQELPRGPASVVASSRRVVYRMIFRVCRTRHTPARNRGGERSRRGQVAPLPRGRRSTLGAGGWGVAPACRPPAVADGPRGPTHPSACSARQLTRCAAPGEATRSCFEFAGTTQLQHRPCQFHLALQERRLCCLVGRDPV